MKKIIFSVFLITLLAAVTVYGARKNISEVIDIDGGKEVHVNLELGAGEFTIAPKDMVEAAKIEISYNPRRTQYIVESEVNRGTCYIELESDHKSKTSMDSDDNIWDISLSKNYPTTLELSIGACEAEFDLGGIPIKEMSLEIGAASGEIDFSKPNPIRMKELNIEAGASSLNVNRIGNASFDEFSFEGGVGSFELDFRGEYEGQSEIQIEIGLGAMDIILPEGVAVRIETDSDNWLSSVDFHGNNMREVDDDVYESKGFDDADDRIVISIEVGLGSIDVFWK